MDVVAKILVTVTILVRVSFEARKAAYKQHRSSGPSAKANKSLQPEHGIYIDSD